MVLVKLCRLKGPWPSGSTLTKSAGPVRGLGLGVEVFGVFLHLGLDEQDGALDTARLVTFMGGGVCVCVCTCTSLRVCMRVFVWQ